MPFAPDFEDVYATIQTAVEGAGRESPLLCFRLDENRPAGRITARLQRELESATFCVADLTGTRSNIMWEVGYAMALGKPTILITQDTSDLPFDIRDMETLRYARDRLSSTLGQPLRRMVVDTVSALVANSAGTDRSTTAGNDLIGELLTQVRELREIVSQSVKSWGPGPAGQSIATAPAPDAHGLEGSWVNEENGTHLYARVIDGMLVIPYCYGGDDELSSAYYGWGRVGEFWFARFSWFDRPITGFAFLRQESVDELVGAWWTDDSSKQIPETPDLSSGVSACWRRIKWPTPAWAAAFFDEVQREGVVARMARRSIRFR